MLTRRTTILAIKEATYGTDPAMTGTNAILAWDVEMDVKGEVLAREFLRDTFTNMPHVIGMKEVALTFKTELKGSNAAPDIDPLLVGVGFGTAVTTGTGLVYTLQSNEINVNSTAFRVYKDGNMHKILGARGSVKLTLEAGKYGIAEWSFSGLYDPVAAVANPDVSGLSQNKPPILYNSSFQIGGFSPVTSKLEIDLGNTVTRRDDLNATYGVRSFRISSRKPKMSFDADAVVEASNPFWGDWTGHIVDTYSISVGTPAGNRLIVSGYFEYETNKYADKDGISSYECNAALVSSGPDTQDDELSLKYIIA
jgi:hypothetical protein